MRALLVRFITDQSGATAIEYALIASGIAGAIVLAVELLGQAVTGRYQAVFEAVRAQGQP